MKISELVAGSHYLDVKHVSPIVLLVCAWESDAKRWLLTGVLTFHARKK